MGKKSVSRIDQYTHEMPLFPTKQPTKQEGLYRLTVPGRIKSLSAPTVFEFMYNFRHGKYLSINYRP